MRALGFLFFCVLTCAASAPSARAAPADYSNIHTIGIISAIGDEVILQRRGTTVFDAKKDGFRLQWNIDGEISEYLTRTFGNKFATKPITVDAEALRHTFMASGLEAPDLGNYLKALPSAASVDAFVVLVPTKAEENAFLARYSKTLFGLGIYSEADLFRTPDYVMPYAAFDLLVIDSKSGNAIAWAPAKTWGGPPYHEGAVVGSCPANMWAQPTDLTDDQKQMIRDQMKILVLSALPRMLTIAGLPSNNSIAAQIPNAPEGCGATY